MKLRNVLLAALLGLSVSVGVASAQGTPTFDSLTVTGATTLGTPLPITSGGTGAITAAGALANLGIAAPSAGCVNIMAHGGNNGGSVDNAAALTASVAAGVTAAPCVYLPPGNFAFASQAVITLPSGISSVTIEGAGADVTNLSWAAGGGLSIKYNGVANSAHVRDLSITTAANNTGHGLELLQTFTPIANPDGATSDITGVTFRATSGYAVNNVYWHDAVYISSVSNVNLINDNFMGGNASTGNGVTLLGTSADVGIAYNFTDDNFLFNGVGIVYGNEVQGVTVSQSNFTVDGRAILVQSGGSGLDQLTVADSQIQVQTEGIDLESNVNPIIHGNLFILSSRSTGVISGTGVQLSGLSIMNNQFGPNGVTAMGNGISIGGGTSPGIIADNAFAVLASGIGLGTSSSQIQVSDNSFVSNTSNFVDNGTGNFVLGSRLAIAAAGVGLSSNTPTNITHMTVPPGDWEITGQFSVGGATGLGFFQGGINTVSATMPTTVSGLPVTVISGTLTSPQSQPMMSADVILTTATNVWCVVEAGFTGGSPTSGCYIKARLIHP